MNRKSNDQQRGGPGAPRHSGRPFRKKPLRTALPRPQPPRGPTPGPKAAERVAKVIARAGLGSRREAEEWIEAGRVAVNDEVIFSPALNVQPSDRITVDGRPLPARERTRLFLYHKPRGLVTTTADPEGRPTIFAALPENLPRLVSVGRLDLNTEGLLLLTNDGGLARVLELPETGWLRRYRVRAHGRITQDRLDALRGGIEVDGVRYGSIEATLDREQGANVWITFAMREGKNREIRNVLGALGLEVNRLIRVSYGPFQLGDLREGQIEEVRTRTLRDQLGERIAALAGTDFSASIVEREAAPRAELRPEARKRDRHDADDQRSRKRGDRERAEAPMKPRGREPARAGHVWRDRHEPRRFRSDSTRKHGNDRAALAERDERRPTVKTSGLLKDQKGRRVLVERIRPAEPGRPSRSERWREQRRERSDAPRENRRFKPFSKEPRERRADRPRKHKPDRPPPRRR